MLDFLLVHPTFNLSVYPSCWLCPQNISRIQLFIITTTRAILAQATNLSHLDYCSSIRMGIPALAFIPTVYFPQAESSISVEEKGNIFTINYKAPCGLDPCQLSELLYHPLPCSLHSIQIGCQAFLKLAGMLLPQDLCIYFPTTWSTLPPDILMAHLWLPLGLLQCLLSSVVCPTLLFYFICLHRMYCPLRYCIITYVIFYYLSPLTRTEGRDCQFCSLFHLQRLEQCLALSRFFNKYLQKELILCFKS